MAKKMSHHRKKKSGKLKCRLRTWEEYQEDKMLFAISKIEGKHQIITSGVDINMDASGVGLTTTTIRLSGEQLRKMLIELMVYCCDNKEVSKLLKERNILLRKPKWKKENALNVAKKD